MDTFVIVEFPDIQYYEEAPGFEDNSFLINDEHGLQIFGSSAYFINKKWLEETNKYLKNKKKMIHH